jgi:sodium/bile acid cotransporter 7
MIHLQNFWPQAISNKYRLLFIVVVLLAIIIITLTNGVMGSDDNHNLTNKQRIEKLVKQFYAKFDDIPWLTPREFITQRQSKQWVILDVRPQAERAISMIPGALTLEQFDLDTYQDSHVLVYCTVGYRSGIYVGELQEKGIKAFNLWGGVLAWALEGETFVTPNGQQTRKVHVYGRKWNVLPDGYEAIW